MKSLTPEQQAFAEEHHGLLLDFMAKHISLIRDIVFFCTSKVVL